MSKRWFLGVLIAGLVVAALGCSGQQAKSPSASGPAAASTTGFKIGIMTGTVSQNEEEFRAGEQVARASTARASSTSPTPTTSCRSRRR